MNTEELTGQTPPILDAKISLRPQVAENFLKMQQQAKNDGVLINLVSGYRDFYRQARMWNGKFLKLSQTKKNPHDVVADILKYTAIPGTSRHHFGTDIDITGKLDDNNKKKIDLLESRHFIPGGMFADVYQWIITNGKYFGFLLTYDDTPNRAGFYFEPWHFSYAPLAKKLLKTYLKTDWKNYISSNEMIKGSDLLKDDFLKNYTENFLKSINPLLIP